MLTAGAAGSQGVDLEVLIGDIDVDFGGLGQHGDGGGGGVDTAGTLGVGHALHAVDTRFELELGECTASPDFRHDLLVTAHRAFAGGDHFDFPALLGRIALVHAEQVAGKQRSLIPSRSRTDFEDHVALVHCIFRKQSKFDFLLERGTPLLELRLLGSRHRAHFRIGGGVRDERIETRDLGNHVAIVANRLDHGTEFGELTRELHIGLRRHLSGELAFDRFVAREQCIEFLLRNHRHLDSTPRGRRHRAASRPGAADTNSLRIKAAALPPRQTP